jgi:FkbM family methyltransferase
MSVVNAAKNAIQQVLNRMGWEIHRYYLSDMAQLCSFLQQHRIDTVLDVGANIGQFGGRLLQTGFAGKVISFEPLSHAHAELSKAAAGHANWQVAPRAAVGAAAGEAEINVSSNLVSSSLLPILDDHTHSAPASRYVGTEKIPVITLDDCPLVPTASRVFLKIDTQGFEQEVLKGARRLLGENVFGVQVELSLAPLYGGQGDYLHILSNLRDQGFHTWALTSEFSDQKTSRLLQANAILFRT